MSDRPDAIVVGSGPSGVSAALPLLEAGMRVVLLDGGRERPGPPDSRAYHDVRRNDAAQWRVFLGEDLEALRPSGPPSPKFDAPGSRFAFEPTAASATTGVEGRGFAAIVSRASGGLSTIWGAGIALYGDEELAEFPLGAADLAESYAAVARRIGVTGFGDDDLATDLDSTIPTQKSIPMSENARRIFERYANRRSAVQALGVRMGRPRTAVLSEAHADRQGCTRCDMCVWGCGVGAIYSAAHDLPALKAHPELDYRPGLVAEAIERDGALWRVVTRPTDGGETNSLSSARVILAAGSLPTTRLVLEMQGRFDETVPVVGVLGLGFALCLPERIGAAVSTRDFSMGQLSFQVDGDPGHAADGAYGSLFPASGLPGALVIDRMPLTRPGAVRLFRHLQPSLVLGNCFVPGRYSKNTARLVRDADGAARLVVQGGVADELAPRLDTLRRQLSRVFRKLGAFAIPSSFTPIGPGEDVRYAATLPMSANPGPGEVDANGELHGAAGLHLVDLSIFPAMPAKHHTLTMMANADRIGRVIARRWSSA